MHDERYWLFTMLVIVTIMTGCRYSPGNHETNSAAVRDVSIEDVRALLSEEITISQLEAKLGAPLVKSEGTWGNIMYALPEKRHLVFFYKSNYITGARYDRTEITGQSPVIHRITIEPRAGSVETMRYEFDGMDCRGIAGLKEALRKLPREAIVEWYGSCRGGATISEVKEISEFCANLGLVLLYYPAG